MELFFINRGVIFAFGVLITGIVFKGLLQAREIAARRKAESAAPSPQKSG
jgi:hypothetical protein